jgi:hypothetical protein
MNDNASLLKQPIIFLGVGRSGTTIISEIIFQHDDLAWISNYQERFPNNVQINRIRPLLDNALWKIRGQKPQLNKISFYNRYAFKPAEGYRFWNYITGSKFNFSRGFLIENNASELEKQTIRALFANMVRFQRRKRLAFKITGPSRIGYLSSIFPDAVFVEVIREPFANIRSLLNVAFWKERGKHQLWWQGAYTDAEVEQAAKWRERPALLTAMQYFKVREVAKKELINNKVNHHIINYEDFICEPRKVIGDLMSKLELRPCRSVESYMQNNIVFDRNMDAKAFFEKADLEQIKLMMCGDNNKA